MEGILETIVSNGIKVVISIVILLIAFPLIGKICRNIQKSILKKGKLDETVTKTLIYMCNIALKIIVVICIVGYLGIDTSGLAALVASLGVCVGLAVNGAVSNLAGGILILVTRPFKIGDYISAQGYEGIVEEIHVINTKIVTVDNKVVYLPNGNLSSGCMVNFSEKELRRVDLDFSIGGNDPDKVKEIIFQTCSECENILTDPAPFAKVTDYGAGNGVKLTLRAWCKSGSYWDARFELLDKVNKAFDKNGVVVPFNQLDVHIKN